MRYSRSQFLTKIYVVISSLYAYLLASLPYNSFSDRGNYKVYAIYGGEQLRTHFENGTFLFFEPLFLLLNKSLEFLKNPELTVKIFVFYISFSFCFFSLNFIKRKYVSLIFILLLFFHIQTFTLQVNALRQGIGVATLLLFFQFKKKINYRSLIVLNLILGFVHNSFFIVAFFLFWDWWLTRKPRRFPWFKRLGGLTGVSVIISLSVFIILSLISSKQTSQYNQFNFRSSGFGFIYWGVVYIYILIMKPKSYQPSNINYIYSLSLIGLTLYLSSYFLAPFAGRMLNSFLPFVFYVILYKPKGEDIIFSFFMLATALYLFFINNDDLTRRLNISVSELFEKLIPFL